MGDNLKLEDVLNAQNIFCIFTGEGNFFLCLDEWMCPAEYKTWYKFSINPFDIDFLNAVVQQEADHPTDHALAPDLEHRFRRALSQYPHPAAFPGGHDDRPFYCVHRNSLNKVKIQILPMWEEYKQKRKRCQRRLCSRKN